MESSSSGACDVYDLFSKGLTWNSASIGQKTGAMADEAASDGMFYNSLVRGRGKRLPTICKYATTFMFPNMARQTPATSLASECMVFRVKL